MITLYHGSNIEINQFEFDETILSLDELKIKIFEDYNIEWAE